MSRPHDSQERVPGARDPRARWADPSAGERYADARWASDSRRSRDPRRITGLLRRHGYQGQDGLLLDAPCGAGRLRPALEETGPYVGLDVSRSMLLAGGGPRCVQGELQHLPFRDRSFEAVVCCRLLHHLADEAELFAVVRELVRVSAGWVVVTFWDAASLPALRRRVFPRRRTSGRVARRRARIERAFAAAEARIVDWDSSLRFVSRQTYGIARRLDP